MKRIVEIFLSAAMVFSFVCGCKSVEENVPAGVTVAETKESVTEILSETTADTVTQTETETEPKIEDLPQILTVSFAAVGDNLIHSSIYKQANERADDDGYDFEYAYKNIEDIIKAADLAVINQETLICGGDYAPSTYPMFNSPPELGEHMLDIGFDVFTMANNHCLDKGEKGLSACIDYWNSHGNAIACGAYRNEFDKNRIRTGEFGGITFSFLSYTESLNGLSLPSGSELIIGDSNDVEGMKEDVRLAKDISDICVVALHWGVEDSDIISDWQRTTAAALSEAGADIIIGNHPHVLRDIEEIEREDGSVTLCAYSLGNFISAQSKGQNLIGGVLEFDVSMPADKSGKPTFGNIRLVPVITHYDGSYGDVRLYPLSEYTREMAEAHGVKSMSRFGYNYIFEVLEKNINEKYFDRDEYYVEE